MKTKAMFINEDEYPFAHWIVQRQKLVETRSRNMLRHLVGERVAVVSTKKGRPPMVIGYVLIVGSYFEKSPWGWRSITMIPEGSRYDTKEGRWFYSLAYAKECDPFPLPEDAVRHGRSWCEF